MIWLSVSPEKSSVGPSEPGGAMPPGCSRGADGARQTYPGLSRPGSSSALTSERIAADATDSSSPQQSVALRELRRTVYPPTVIPVDKP
jgi:hypothetical protein